MKKKKRRKEWTQTQTESTSGMNKRWRRCCSTVSWIFPSNHSWNFKRDSFRQEMDCQMRQQRWTTGNSMVEKENEGKKKGRRRESSVLIPDWMKNSGNWGIRMRSREKRDGEWEGKTHTNHLKREAKMWEWEGGFTYFKFCCLFHRQYIVYQHKFPKRSPFFSPLTGTTSLERGRSVMLEDSQSMQTTVQTKWEYNVYFVPSLWIQSS